MSVELQVIHFRELIHALFGAPKLTIEMIPSSMHGENLHNGQYITQKDWKRLRQKILDKSQNRCQVCDFWSNNPLHCHEVWEYDVEAGIQRLVGLQALCEFCHSVKHAGHAARQGHMGRVITHLAKVNGWSNQEAIRYKEACFDLVKAYDCFDWTLDLSYVGQFGITLLNPPVRKPKPVQTELPKFEPVQPSVKSVKPEPKSTIQVIGFEPAKPVKSGLFSRLANDLRRLFVKSEPPIELPSKSVESVELDLSPLRIKPKPKKLVHWDTIRYPILWIAFLGVPLVLSGSCCSCLIFLRLAF